MTDFLATSTEGLRLIIQAGIQLRQTWPVMQGAVGLWLWTKPAELRSGSVTVWEHHGDVWRFVRWPVHAEIVRSWRERTSPSSDHWRADRFDAADVWARAEALIEQPHPGAT